MHLQSIQALLCLQVRYHNFSQPPSIAWLKQPLGCAPEGSGWCMARNRWMERLSASTRASGCVGAAGGGSGVSRQQESSESPWMPQTEQQNGVQVTQWTLRAPALPCHALKLRIPVRAQTR